MGITFSFREKRKIELDKYDYPVLTQKPYTGEKNSIAKFALNKAALSQLGYPEDLKGCKISIGRDEDTNNIVLVNSTGFDTDNQFNVISDGTFNSKFLLGRLNKSFKMDESTENEYELKTYHTDDGVLYAEIIGFVRFGESEVYPVYPEAEYTGEYIPEEIGVVGSGYIEFDSDLGKLY